MATDLRAFFMENATSTDNVKFVASARFVDPETKKPMEWEITAVDSDMDEKLRKDCTKKVQIPGKKGAYTNDVDTDKYLGLLCATCTVYPNLNDAALQDSWKVKSPDALLKRMLKAGEYAEYRNKVAEINGFDVTMEERVDEAKN